MLKKGFNAIRSRTPAVAKRITRAFVPGAGELMDASDMFLSRFRAIDDLQEEKMGGPFQTRDADQHGATRYNIEQNRAADEVVDAQFALAKTGYLTFQDIDGCVGRGTLAAISDFEDAEGVSFYTGEPLTAETSGEDLSASPTKTDTLVLLSPRARHTSQGASGVGEIEIPGLSPDREKPLNRPVSKIGCASCTLSAVWDFYSDADIDFPDGIEAFISRGCYTEDRDIIWGRAVEVMSVECGRPLRHKEIHRNDAINYIRSNTPVLCHAGRGHWVLAVGHSDASGIVYNDPATQFGDAYENHTRNCERLGDKGYVLDRYIVVRPI